MSLIKPYKYVEGYPKVREKIFINPDHITLVQMARTDDPNPGRHPICSNGEKMTASENLSDSIPASNK